MSDSDTTKPKLTPKTVEELLSLIESVHSKTLGKHAQIVDAVAQTRPHESLPSPGEDADETGLFFGISLAKLPNLLGVRVNITHKDDKVELRSDISMEYTWKQPVNYLDEPLVQFVSNEGIPRALTTASAILSDVAASVGRSVENSSVRMQPDLVAYFEQSYNDRIAQSQDGNED